MGRLRYSINLTLDGCCDHREGVPDAEMHQFWANLVADAGALLYGRVTYEMMEQAWRPMAETGTVPDATPGWVLPFARSIHGARKYVASTTLREVDWNARLITGDLRQAVEQIKREEDGVISLGGVNLARSIAALGLIDEYIFVVQPRIAGHGPTLLSGLPSHIDLKLTDQRTFDSGAVVLTYEARR